MTTTASAGRERETPRPHTPSQLSLSPSRAYTRANSGGGVLIFHRIMLQERTRTPAQRHKTLMGKSRKFKLLLLSLPTVLCPISRECSKRMATVGSSHISHNLHMSSTMVLFCMGGLFSSVFKSLSLVNIASWASGSKLCAQGGVIGFVYVFLSFPLSVSPTFAGPMGGGGGPRLTQGRGRVHFFGPPLQCLFSS